MASEPDWLLIVEPDPVIRHPLAEYLRECGYKVLEAGGYDEAMALLREGKARIDLILCDVHAPGKARIDLILCDVHAPGKVDGFGLATWVREHAPHIQVVLAGTVAKAAEKAGDICEDGPALSKPYDHQLLLDRIKRLLAARDRNMPK